MMIRIRSEKISKRRVGCSFQKCNRAPGSIITSVRRIVWVTYFSYRDINGRFINRGFFVKLLRIGIMKRNRTRSFNGWLIQIWRSYEYSWFDALSRNASNRCSFIDSQPIRPWKRAIDASQQSISTDVSQQTLCRERNLRDPDTWC